MIRSVVLSMAVVAAGCGHAHDAALGLLAVRRGGLAILAVQLELQRRPHHKLRRLERTAELGTADVLIGRSINDQVVLLVLLLFGGAADGLQVFEGSCLDQAVGQSGGGK